jgi:hypothetical protein
MSEDEPYTPFGGRIQGPPTLTLVERLWRLRNPRNFRVLSCGLYLHPHGIEARCGYDNEANLLWSQVTKLPDEARARAEEWKAFAIEKGFTEVTKAQ